MTAPVPPLDLREPVTHEEAMSLAMREAMTAALGGDFAALDALELAFLNLLVRIGELLVKHPDGTPYWWFDQHDARYAGIDRDVHAPFVVAVLRGFDRHARTALQWALREKCRRCAGKLRRVDCRVCDGRWYVTGCNDHEVLYTDVEGALIAEGR